MDIKRLLWAAACVMLIGASNPVLARNTDTEADLYAEYIAWTDHSTVEVDVCGRGCFGGRNLQPFDYACEVLEGAPIQTKKNIVKRAIYVLDKRTSATAPVTLTVFTRTDKLDGAGVVRGIYVKRTKKINLGFTGGAAAQCFLAASPGLVYAGTDTGGAARIDKATFELFMLREGAGLKSITADDRGFVSVSTQASNVMYGPDGDAVQEGGGYDDVVSTSNGWKPN